jgi:hypothetical protein
MVLTVVLGYLLLRVCRSQREHQVAMMTAVIRTVIIQGLHDSYSSKSCLGPAPIPEPVRYARLCPYRESR